MTIEQQIAALRKLSPAQLREKYLEVFSEPSRSGNKDFLFKRVAWRIQSLAEGGLSERARRRAMDLARDADVRLTMPRPKAAAAVPERTVVGSLAAGDTRLPMPGAVLTRTYRGQKIQVTVLPHGFDYDGTVYRSLSAVAKAVTGSHWNGYGFFGLKESK
jgi:hypothetical protein